MTEHAHRGVREDVGKKRREYLRTKARVIIPAIIAGALSIFLIGFVLRLACQSHTMSDAQFGVFVLYVILTVPCTLTIIYCEKKALSIPYVPPVAIQIAALPAEEVLLRGSEQPPANPDELLRAARGAETDSQDLLRPDQISVVRIAVLLVALTVLPLLTAQMASGKVLAATDKWGRIANRLHQGEKLRCALFFAGPPNPASLPLYTRHPRRSGQDNGMSKASVNASLKEMRQAGLNAIKLSYWGHDGETERFGSTLLFSRRRWPGDTASGRREYTEAEQVQRAQSFFQQAKAQGLLVAPMLEVSPEFRFYDEFPTRLNNLVERASWLLKHFGNESNWLQLYDQQGQPRHVIWLIESIHRDPIAPILFAQGFERASQSLYRTGYRVGFVLDPTPLPAYGSHNGPTPRALRACPSILAINPFNITSQGLVPHQNLNTIAAQERQDYARSLLGYWSDSGIPLIAPIMPGYDAHLVTPNTGVYGFNAEWRRQQKELALRYQTGGISIDVWNGWTQGYAIPPSTEEGETNLNWVKDVLQSLPK